MSITLIHAIQHTLRILHLQAIDILTVYHYIHLCRFLWGMEWCRGQCGRHYQSMGHTLRPRYRHWQPRRFGIQDCGRQSGQNHSSTIPNDRTADKDFALFPHLCCQGQDTISTSFRYTTSIAYACGHCQNLAIWVHPSYSCHHIYNLSLSVSVILAPIEIRMMNTYYMTTFHPQSTGDLHPCYGEVQETSVMAHSPWVYKGNVTEISLCKHTNHRQCNTYIHLLAPFCQCRCPLG